MIRKLEATAPAQSGRSQHELDHFYAALLKGGTVRILHYGDSPTTGDLITADARALLQKQFGDAGTGFVLIARPWAWYNHRGVEMEALQLEDRYRGQRRTERRNARPGRRELSRRIAGRDGALDAQGHAGHASRSRI